MSRRGWLSPLRAVLGNERARARARRSPSSAALGSPALASPRPAAAAPWEHPGLHRRPPRVPGLPAARRPPPGAQAARDFPWPRCATIPSFSFRDVFSQSSFQYCSVADSVHALPCPFTFKSSLRVSSFMKNCSFLLEGFLCSQEGAQPSNASGQK